MHIFKIASFFRICINTSSFCTASSIFVDILVSKRKKMYSMILHYFIKLGMRWNIALIDFRTPPELACTDKSSIELLIKICWK